MVTWQPFTNSLPFASLDMPIKTIVNILQVSLTVELKVQLDNTHILTGKQETISTNSTHQFIYSD